MVAITGEQSKKRAGSSGIISHLQLPNHSPWGILAFQPASRARSGLGKAWSKGVYGEGRSHSSAVQIL